VGERHCQTNRNSFVNGKERTGHLGKDTQIGRARLTISRLVQALNALLISRPIRL
jgi:hypothetical protein